MSYYTMPCLDWAKRFQRNHSGSKILKITPKGGVPFLGPILLPNGEKRSDPPWYHHYVVYYAGRVYDQAYANGISPQEYKKKFEYWDVLQFPVGCGL